MCDTLRISQFPRLTVGGVVELLTHGRARFDDPAPGGIYEAVFTLTIYGVATIPSFWRTDRDARATIARDLREAVRRPPPDFWRFFRFWGAFAPRGRNRPWPRNPHYEDDAIPARLRNFAAILAPMEACLADS